MAGRNVRTREQNASAVRCRAEKLWTKRQTVRGGLPRGAALLKLTQELEIHQIELELQNEELCRVREALEANYNELYDFAPVGYFTFDELGVIRKMNLTGAEMLGRERSTLMRKRFAEFVTPALRLKFHAFMRNAQQRKEGCMLTLMKASAIGLEVPVYVYAEVTPLKGELRAVVIDITSIHQAELATRQVQQRLSLAMAATKLGVWMWEFASTELYWSEGCSRIFGVDQLCVKLDTVKNLLHPDDAPQVMMLFRETPDETATRSLEFRIIRPDGKVAWVESTCETQYEVDGKPAAIVGTLRDISSGKQRDEGLRQALADKEALLRQIPSGIARH